MENILERVQVNMPFRLLVDRYLPLVIRERINPEIGFDCFALDSYSEKDFREIASRLSDAELSITFHAPFFDLRPGSLDRRIRQTTIDRFRQVFDLVPLYRPRTIVFHASFDIDYYIANEEVWLENSRDTWSNLITLAEDLNTVIALENVYEHDPSMLSRLMRSFERPDHIRMCFDTGHFNTFSKVSLDEWLDEIGSFIGEIHLHDNGGEGDSHAPVGEGTFPFYRLFHYLKDHDARPVITLEPHTEEHMWRTVDNIKRLGLLESLD
ncbi:MAG: sugar phosphate isomerase/epimerase [Deltaproteobacteria bacterium]|nr:sugar phosphate isomerase/epimerase [Deltaproteobacteria bacterium]MBN2687259.1 sugar phosphate isomerase/epimerase [Deltaproteobacteria bacterium]